MAAEKRCDTGFDLQPVFDGGKFHRGVGAEARCMVGETAAGGAAEFDDRNGVPVGGLRERSGGQEECQEEEGSRGHKMESSRSVGFVNAGAYARS